MSFRRYSDSFFYLKQARRLKKMDLADGNESMNDVHYRLYARGYQSSIRNINEYFIRMADQIAHAHRYATRKRYLISYNDVALDMNHWLIYYNDKVTIRPYMGRRYMIDECHKIEIAESAAIQIIKTLPMPIADEIIEEYCGAAAYDLLKSARIFFADRTVLSNLE